MITATPRYNNVKTHQKIKYLMMRKTIFDVQIDNEQIATISYKSSTRVTYKLSDKSWQWLLTYLKTGDYEDFGVDPNDRMEKNSSFLLNTAKSFIEQGFNVKRIPFLRETEATVRLIILFDFGKIYIDLKRTNDLMIYLEQNGL